MKSPSGYFNQTYTVEYTIPGSLDGSTFVPLNIAVPSENDDPQQFYRPEIEDNAGLFDVDYVVNEFNRRGATGARFITQIWLVSPVTGGADAEIQVVDAVDGAPIVQEVVASLVGLTEFFRTIPPVEVPQGSLLRIVGFTNSGVESIKLRLTITFTNDLIAASAALCECEGIGEISIQNEGVLVGDTGILNFTGAGVTVTDDPANNRINIDIGGGGGPAPGGVPETLEVGQVGAAGASLAYARVDHDHAVPAAAPVTVTGGTNSAGIATTFPRSDHQHRLEVAIQDSGAAVGARPTLNIIGATVVDNGGLDRVDITIPAAPAAGGVPEQLDVGQVGAAGISTNYAREDHVHAVPAGTPVTVGQANSAGVATTFARSDHVHRTLVEIESNGVFFAARPTLNITGAGAPTLILDVPGDDIELNFPAAAAETWAATLVAGNVSGGTDAVMSIGDELRGVDQAVAGSNAGELTLRGGDYTGGGAGTEVGGAFTLRAGSANTNGGTAQPLSTIAGGDQTGTSTAAAGALLVRGGDRSGSAALSFGGAITVRAGTSTGATAAGGAAEFAGGDSISSGSFGGQATLRGGDKSLGGAGTAGIVLVRGGDSPATGATANANGGNLNLRGGAYRTGIGGAGTNPGGVFIRSGQLDASAGSTAGTTGDVRITTNANATVGNMPSTSGASTATGDIQIDTIGPGATGIESGDITIQTGTVTGSGGTGPGNIILVAGNFSNTAGVSSDGGSITGTAGSSNANANSPGGSISWTAGAQLDTDTNINSPGGSVSLVAGASAKNAATSGGGQINITGGGATGLAGTGGNVNVTAGSNTAAGASTGVGGSVLITSGGSTSATGSGSGGAITGTAGNAAGSGAGSGGAVSFTAGSATAAGGSGSGGAASLIAGAAAGSGAGAGGTVTITAGATSNAAGSGVGGSVNITAGAAAGSGNAGSITLQAGLSSSGTDGDINEFTHTEASVRIRTQTGALGSENEAKTLVLVDFVATGGTTTTVTTLDTLTTNGRNTKLHVEITAVDDAALGDQSTTLIIQSAFRAAGTVTLFTAFLGTPIKFSVGGGGTFAADVSFSLVVSGDNINLIATNADPADRTGNLAIRWWRQEGGFTAV